MSEEQEIKYGQVLFGLTQAIDAIRDALVDPDGVDYLLANIRQLTRANKDLNQAVVALAVKKLEAA